MRYLVLSSLGLLLIALVLSCSGSGVPTEPSNQIRLPESGGQTSGTRASWGVWDVVIDPTMSSVVLIPDRALNFQSNVVNFLQPPIAPINLLTIEIDPLETDFSIGKVACDITIQHPFPGSKFCGFDVMGIVMGDWDSYALQSDPQIITSLPPNTLLQNPDGWTRWWNESEFTSYGTLLGYIEGAKANPDWTCTHTLNPYKYFSDDLGTSDSFDPDPEVRGFFSSGDPGMNSRRYCLKFSDPDNFRFKYAISASWVAPYNNVPNDYDPSDFPISANMPEAYKIDIIDNGSTAFYNGPTTYGGDLNLIIEIRDWQIGGTLSSIADEVKGITIESPTLFPDPIYADLSGGYPDPWNNTIARFPLLIEDVTPSGLNDQLVLVTVESADPITYEPQIPGLTDYDYPSGPLSAYSITNVPVIAQWMLSGWPTFRKNHARTGRTSIIGPSTNNTKFVWTIPPDGENRRIASGISLDSQQRAVFNTDMGYVYCVDQYGETAWSFYIGTGFGGGLGCSSTPAIGPDDSVYIGNEVEGFYHISPDGELIWATSPVYGQIEGGTVLQSDGSVLYTTDRHLVKVDKFGGLEWEVYFANLDWVHFNNGGIDGGPAVGSDGSIYVTCGWGLVAFDQLGNVLWLNKYADDNLSLSPALGSSGIYFGSQDGYFYCVDYNGDVVWTIPIGDGIQNVPAIGDNGKVYFGSWNKEFYCVDQMTGEIDWSYSALYGISVSSPIIDGDGKIYFCDGAGYIYCLNSDGDLVWEDYLGGKVWCFSPAIAEDGTFLIGSTDLPWGYADGPGKLFAFRDE